MLGAPLAAAPSMPHSVATRLVLIEERLEDLIQLMNGGPEIEFARSVRGRLHMIENTLRGADKLADAAREVRLQRVRQWSRAEKLIGLGLGLLAALAPYVVAFYR
jgi:hypothetical protein